MRREGRGWLSSIDRLPDWAEPALVNARAALRENKLPQIEIHSQFNAELRELGRAAGVVDPPQISASAFNRRTMRLAHAARRSAEVREMGAALAEKRDQTADDDVTVAITEMTKVVLWEMTERAEGLPPSGKSAEMIANLSAALVNTERAKKLMIENRVAFTKHFAARVEKALDKVTSMKGLSPEAREAFRRELFGITDEADHGA